MDVMKNSACMQTELRTANVANDTGDEFATDEADFAEAFTALEGRLPLDVNVANGSNDKALGGTCLAHRPNGYIKRQINVSLHKA